MLYDHAYSSSPNDIEHKLQETKQKLQDAKKELKGLKKKLKRRNDIITKFLKTVKDQDIISQGQLDLLQLNFGEKTFTLIENELHAQGRDKHNLRFSNLLSLYIFTVLRHMSSCGNFWIFLTQITICKWGSSINCQPRFLSEVIITI